MTQSVPRLSSYRTPRAVADTPASRFSLPAARRRYRFTLTPLADTMFQLLIFFMLSANMTPYALLPIQSGTLGTARPSAEPAEEVAQTPVEGQVGNPMMTAVWSVGAGSVVANGQRFPLDRIPDLARALRAQNTPEVLLIVQRGADVQMLVSILETLSDAGIALVRVADGGGV